MVQVKILPRTVLLLGSFALLVAASAISQRASAQYAYQCPAGYYYVAGYGCAPLSYYYGSPGYIYPDTGFGFFYGGGWGGGYRGGGWGRGYHGGGGHGGVGHGGGGHIGGGHGHR
ncbi:MAG: hypothetical protein ACHQC9_05560 [Alphaproteobacteria bacterium]